MSVYKLILNTSKKKHTIYPIHFNKTLFKHTPILNYFHSLYLPISTPAIPTFHHYFSRCSSHFTNNKLNTDMNINYYHSIADKFLYHLEESLLSSGIDEKIEEDIDIVLAQGVLTINLASKGTWVINKQAPNRQVWWSSPISGPKRFEFNDDLMDWIDIRDGMKLVDIFNEELKQTFKFNFNIK